MDVSLVPIDNVIVEAKTDRGRWVQEATAMIGPARAKLRSTYFHWAMAINGLHVAAERYSQPGPEFFIMGARTDRSGAASEVPLAVWSREKARDGHMSTIPKMFAWGYVELYAALEEFVFDVYRLFLEHHPELLLRGPEFRDLRRLYREVESNEGKRDEWRDAWARRLDTWQRKKLFQGLHRVFLSFCKTAGVKEPSDFEKTTVETWAETIEGVGLVRHLLVHGEALVPEELAAFCEKPVSLGFAFKEGEPLRLDLHHLWGVECFSHDLLSALNRSLVEHPDANA